MPFYLHGHLESQDVVLRLEVRAFDAMYAGQRWAV